MMAEASLRQHAVRFSYLAHCKVFDARYFDFAIHSETGSASSAALVAAKSALTVRYVLLKMSQISFKPR